MSGLESKRLTWTRPNRKGHFLRALSMVITWVISWVSTLRIQSCSPRISQSRLEAQM